MSPVIKLNRGGKPASKKTAVKTAGSKTTTSKPKATTTRKTAAKPAAKKAAAKPAAKKTTTRQATTTKADPKVIATFEKKLASVGKKRDDTLRAHEAAVQDVFETVQAAIEMNVPMSTISRSVGVSRQWLYKMSAFKGRNGNPQKGSAEKNLRQQGRKQAARKSAAKKVNVRS